MVRITLTEEQAAAIAESSEDVFARLPSGREFRLIPLQEEFPKEREWTREEKDRGIAAMDWSEEFAEWAAKQPTISAAELERRLEEAN